MARLKAKRIIDTINKGIAVNPTTFDVKHEERVSDGDGGFEIQEKTITYKGLIYFEDGSSSLTVIAKAIGTEYTQDNWHMILSNENEIKVDEKNLIQFTTIDGTFKIKTANPFVIESQICGYLCDLERM